MKSTPRIFVYVASMLLNIPFVNAQEYPAKPSRIIVTVLPGGGSDLLARLVSQRMSETLGRPFVVEYRPGGDSAIGLEAIAKSAPDGYTWGVATSGLSIHQALSSKKRPFDAIKDFTPIVLLATTTTVLAGKAALPPDNLNQLIAYAKKQGQKMTFASCSNGSSQHLAGELFAQLAGVQLTHVPFKGCTQGIPLVLNGEIDMIVNTLANLSVHIKAGKLKPYAVTGSTRSQFAPELPTLAELGLTGGAMDNWFGLIGPAGMPPAIVTRINREANTSLTAPEGREKLIALQYDLRGGSANDFSNHIRTEIERFSKVKGIKIGDE